MACSRCASHAQQATPVLRPVRSSRAHAPPPGQAELRAARERTEPADPTTLRAEKVARFKRDKEVRNAPLRLSFCSFAPRLTVTCAVRADVRPPASLAPAIIAARSAAGCTRSSLRPQQGEPRRRCASQALCRCLLHDGTHCECSRADALRRAERETDASCDDEAATREAWLLRIAAAVVRALDLGPSLAMETQMLAMRASSGGNGRALQPRPQPEQASLAQGVAQAAAALARSDRERLRDGVFRPSHILPTMTIEQFGAPHSACAFMRWDSSWLTWASPRVCDAGEMEVARMQAEAAEGARRQARKEAELRNGPPPDFDAEEDAETRKARAWDDWKVRMHSILACSCCRRVFCAPELTACLAQDDHPYGSGNSKRRPCG